jgi:prepilin-type N-terminal cleavage/methylation domain-containing protein
MGISHTPHTESGPRSGFTLIELLAVVVILAALSLSIASVFSSSQIAVAEMTADAAVDMSLLRLHERLDSELRFARLEDVDLIDSQTLLITTVVGWDGTSAILGTPRWFSLAKDQLMLDNTALIDGVTVLDMTLVGNELTIDLSVAVPFTVRGGTNVANRTSVIRHRFDD